MGNGPTGSGPTSKSPQRPGPLPKAWSPPAGRAPDAFSTQGTPQQPRLLLALLSHRPIRAKDTSYPSPLATSGSHSNPLRGGNCACCPFSYWPGEMSISDAIAYPMPCEEEGGARPRTRLCSRGADGAGVSGVRQVMKTRDWASRTGTSWFLGFGK